MINKQDFWNKTLEIMSHQNFTIRDFENSHFFFTYLHNIGLIISHSDMLIHDNITGKDVKMYERTDKAWTLYPKGRDGVTFFSVVGENLFHNYTVNNFKDFEEYYSFSLRFVFMLKELKDFWSLFTVEDFPNISIEYEKEGE